MHPPKPRRFLRLVLLLGLFWATPAVAQLFDPIEISRSSLRRADRLWKEGYIQAACLEYAKSSIVATEWWYPASLRLACPVPAPDAIRLLTSALNKVPNPFSLHLALFSAHASRGNTEQAALHLAEALALDHSNPAHLYQYAQLLSGLGRRAKAMETLTQAIETFPQLTPFLVRYAKTAEEAGRMELAEWGWRNLALHGVNPLRNLNALAQFYQRAGCDAERHAVALQRARKRPLPKEFLPSQECAKKLGTR